MTPQPAPADGDRPAPANRVRTVLRWVGLLLVISVVVAVLWGKVPDPDEIVDALGRAHRGWLAAALFAQFASIGLFARQQRHLLRAFGVRMSLHRAAELSYARSAIAISLPAGSALSAGFAFRQFRASGASRTTAATVMILSGLASTVALVLLYLTGLLAAAVGPIIRAGESRPGLTVAVGVALAATVAAIITISTHKDHLPLHLRRQQHHQPACGRRLERVSRRWPRLGTWLGAMRDAFNSVRDVPKRHQSAVLGFAAANWLADLGCLVASAKAFDLDVSIAELAAIYLGVQVVRQIPLTPGGIGVIEASLLAGMISAGAAEGSAVGAVLVYRLLSCWLIIPIGFLAWARLQRVPIAGSRSVPTPDAVPADQP
jgi:putative heme transporter